MSQVIRRILMAAGLTMALLLAVPAPSHAAQARKPAAGHSLNLVARAWSWLESLLGDSKQSGGQHGKDVMTTPLPPPPPPEQGPLIDPNGANG
ncbi:MAG TPA: hypothetical protein VFR03_19215 [Thermoanaerobaculia bacterium]|nr:hypothetical protein [Thermoanaerobaculia bacterium]